MPEQRERDRARHRVANMTPQQVEAKRRRDNKYRRHRRATDPELREREREYSRQYRQAPAGAGRGGRRIRVAAVQFRPSEFLALPLRTFPA